MTACRIRAGRNSPSTGSFEWVTLDDKGSVLESGAAPLRQPPANGACELLVASDLVLIERIPAPAAQQRRISSALRFLAEDSAIPDPERLHVAAAPASAKDTICVGIVDRQWMEQMLARLERSGLIARSAYPECLLPEMSPDTWTVVWNGENSFARIGEMDGFALDNPDHGDAPVALRLALDEARNAAAVPDRLIVRVAAGAIPPDTEQWSADLGVPFELGPEWSWVAAGRRPALDLLQGEFAPHAIDGNWTRVLRRPAILAVALLILSSFGIAVDWAAKVQERASLQGEMEGIFRAAFGESAVVVDAPLQMDRALAQLRHQSGQVGPGDFLAIFGAVSERLLDPAKHRIESIAYVNGALSLSIRPHDAAQFSALFNELRAKTSIPGLEVRLEPAESSGKFSLQVSAGPGRGK